jgi:C-terminal processing protease CtpA/Prc
MLGDPTLSDDRRIGISRRLAASQEALRRSLYDSVETRITNISGDATVGPAHYAGDLYVLIDGGCASACEGLLIALRRHPTAHVVGQRTAGEARFGDTVWAQLPRSRIRVTIPTAVYVLHDGSFAEKVGFEPQESIERGSDALAVVLARLEAE